MNSVRSGHGVMREMRPNRRPRLPKVSDEMKAWSAALAAEFVGLPDVATRPMFGLTALYLKGKIFAALPRARGMETPNSLAFKLETAKPRVLARAKRDPRVSFTQMQKTSNMMAKWEIQIPNGFYWVHIVGGDSDNVDTLQFNVEGVLTRVAVTAATTPLAHLQV